MGQRASLAILEGGKLSLHYDHWIASRLDVDLFWGPGHARPLIRAQGSTDQWLDTTWAEGGALLNSDARSVLWFGGEEVRWDVPWRRRHLEMMQNAWAPWSVAWARNGILDILDALGIPAGRLIADRHDGEYVAPWPATMELEWVECLISADDGAELRLFPATNSAVDTDGFVGGGPSALARLSGPVAALTFNEFPHGGVHVSTALRRIGYWRADFHPPALERVRNAWGHLCQVEVRHRQ